MPFGRLYGRRGGKTARAVTDLLPQPEQPPVQLPNPVQTVSLNNCLGALQQSNYNISTSWTTISSSATIVTPPTWVQGTISNIITTGVNAATNDYWNYQHSLYQQATGNAVDANQQQAYLQQMQQQLYQQYQAETGINLNPNPLTVEQLAAATLAIAEQERIATAARSTAMGRARKLLIANLSPEQRRSFEAREFFDIHKPAHLYRVFKGRSANVILYRKPSFGHPVPDIALCAHPADYVPDEDTMLAQKFMIEHDEPGFLRLANRHQLDSSYARRYLAQAA